MRIVCEQCARFESNSPAFSQVPAGKFVTADYIGSALCGAGYL